MATIDEASGAVGGNADDARELASKIAASKGFIESLAAATASLGMETKANEANAASERAEEIAGQADALADALDALRAQIEALRGLLPSGATDRVVKPPELRPSTTVPGPNPGRSPDAVHPTVTRPAHAPDPNRRPSGPPAVVEGGATKEVSIRRENESAAVLAAAGYEIEQNPPTNTAGKNPDYRIQGELWDCYAPTGSSTRTIHTQIRKKVGKAEEDRQADRIILNLDGCGASPADIRARLERSPIRGLREIKIVKDGKVVQFFPWDSEANHGD